MKTFEEFCEEKERNRRDGLRPGNEKYNGFEHYLGFKFENGRYTFFEGSRTLLSEVDFEILADSLCDLVEEAPSIRYELNFSEEFPEEEKRVFQRIVRYLFALSACCKSEVNCTDKSIGISFERTKRANAIISRENKRLNTLIERCEKYCGFI
jgi:hypothetical protein